MHVSKSAIALAVTAALPALSLVGSSDAGAASKLARAGHADPHHAAPHFKYPVHSRAMASSVLYDQSGTAAGGLPSQNFESTYDAYDSAGADDFMVSDAAGWGVDAFNFQIIPTGDPSSATYDINVYSDAGGLPGAATSCAYSALPGTLDPSLTSLSVSLPTPCNLAPGTYWVSVIANLDLAVGGQVFWSTSTQTPAPGSDAAWENPGDGFGSGCTTWSDNPSCSGSSGFTTALFQVIGTVGIQSGCTPSGICLQSTVGTDLSAGACGAADTLDATVGDQLNFCYTVTNNTGVELDYHSLANNIDGALLSFAQQALAPGASYQYNHVETVSQTNTYNATWTGQDVPSGYAAAVESGGGACVDRIFADGFGDGPAPCGTFIEISGTGTPLGLLDDDSVTVTMPFSFPYYGSTSNALSVANNGGILFGAPGAVLSFANVSLPAASLSAPAILPLWDDFDSSHGDVYTDTRGSAPNRQFIVEWYQRSHYFSNADTATFEVIFNEADGTLQFEYADVAYNAANFGAPDPSVCDGGVCATIGLQASSTLANQYSAFSASITDNTGIKWTPTSPQVFTSTDSVTVNVGAPQIVVNPSPITGTVTAGAQTALPFVVENHGNRDLNWSLTEAGPSILHFAPPGSRYAMPMGDPSKSSAARAPFKVQKPGAHPHPRQPFAGVTAFAVEAFSDAFETLDVTADNGSTFLGSAQGSAFAFKFLDGDFSKAYGIDKFGSMQNTFASIDTTTGAITPIGTADANMDSNGFTGFAQDPTTGTLYASGATCGSSSHLYTIDRNTGAATPVGQMTGMGCAIWIAIGPDGLMYSVDIVNDALYAVDKTTGATSLIGSVGFNVNYGQDADFDQSTGILYWAAFNADTISAEMRTVDLATGMSSLVYPLAGAEVVGLATETIGGGCAQPQDLPWLSIDPSTGTTFPSGATPTLAIIDATTANPGDVLAGNVCATSNDPVHHRLATPITVTVGAPLSPPTVAKAFNPAQVTPGTTSTLTITLANGNATDATLNVPLVDFFPNNLVIANTPNAQTTCGGAVTATPGTGSVVLDAAGAMIPANGSCTITVDVIGTTPFDYANDIPAGALDTSAGMNLAPADATLSVAFNAPTLVKSFAPTSITIGTTSTLTITLGNSNGIPTSLTAPLTDSFPPGLVVAAGPNAQTTCAAGNVTAAAGDIGVTLGSGAVIPAGGVCTVTVDVTVAAATGSFANTIPPDSLHTVAGANVASADATLNVTPIPPTVTKAFGASTVSVNVPTTLTITLGNANATPAALTAALMDTFPIDLVVAATPNASTTCLAGVTATPGSGFVKLDGGASIPGSGSCTITVDVESAIVGTYDNDIPAGALQTSQGSNVVATDASLDVTP